jgi:hypothetical protein
MTQILDITQNLEATQKAISETEKALIAHPNMPSLRLMLASLYKRQSNLEVQFAKEANAQARDVCAYRLFAEDGSSPSIRSFTSALGDFQAWYTLVYDAVVNNTPKNVNRVSVEAMKATAFEYGYSYSGSIGFVMTLPNERLLIEDTHLDLTFRTVFEMASATSSDQIAYFASKLGKATVRSLYRWASDHVEGGLGADIDWRRNDEVRAQLFIQLPQLEALRATIAETSDNVIEHQSITGTLVGADLNVRSFHITTEGGGEIRGRMSEAIGLEYAVSLPMNYVAQIRKTTKVNYATESEDIDYYLLSLEPLTIPDAYAPTLDGHS